jgi:tetratricopeptide (TPR) repeat protein
LPDGITNLQKAVKLTQEERWVYNELGWAAYENHQNEIALDAFSQAARLEPSSSMYPLMQGTILSQQGQWAQAKTFFDAAIALDTTKIELYKAAIEAAQKAGDKTAVAHYQGILPRK